MRRKQMNTAAANTVPIGDAPPSPASTGAMDTLLEKLRAAAPQTRDTRDRRRRARLKDRHQVRVASGQRIPETGENVDESGLLSPTSMEGGSEDAGSSEGDRGATSEGEDIADRAASMLQGLRGDGGEGSEGGPGRDDSLRVRRRRESADDERAKRRARRRAAGTSISESGTGSAGQQPRQSAIPEEAEVVDLTGDDPATVENGADGEGERTGSRDGQLPTPTTVVVPPSPTASEKSVKRGGDA